MAFSFNNGGMRSVYFLCLIFCVGEANFIDDLLGSLGNIKTSGSIDHQTKPRLAIEANWKWTASPAPSAPPSGLGVFDVTQYGAKADGTSESSKAFLEAWKAACSFPGKSWFVIPKGEFLLGEISFEGPCRNKICPSVDIKGTLKAVKDLKAYSDKSWITFRRLDGLTISGGGTLDGQGAEVWRPGGCKKDCQMLPVSLKLVSVSNAKVGQIYLINSKAFHMHVTRCQNTQIYDVKITAPEESTNTDGIHISSSTSVQVVDSFIGVGDDCVSMGDGNTNLLVSNVFCGPGHGISIGSLGKEKNEEPVTGIHVKNCTLTGTTNGIRIKTWPGSPELLASNFTFEDIVMDNAAFPIIIDQHYCPSKSCGGKPPSKVKIRDVVYKNIRGVSFSRLAVNLMCSAGSPCENIQLSDIDIAYQDPEKKTASLCNNAKVTTSGKQNPPPCT
ncbi:putative Polygalacturonase 4 [Cinnamomum micranthum f. kanehirae]|uniref:Putative Polygalacturonase 4 n=1 Tax=Cinnamomum micranthum f. kanehirae TaxID=337451 RepID=A0A443PV30_9MAGN|nr:putative Polygalacturonase 4 [Cinnamomum micranthum f. kanehirae]